MSSDIINLTNNQLIIKTLKQLASHLSTNPENKYRTTAIKSAITILEKINKPIHSADDLKGITKLGKGILSRVDEILQTGSLIELHNKSDIIKEKEEKEEEDLIKIATNELMEITGIGPKRAADLIKSGILTIANLKEQIKQRKLSLPHHIMIGLKYHEDLKKRIPRYEIEIAERIMHKVINHYNPSLIMNICGSYRRGCETSGDIDVLITNPDSAKSNTNILIAIVNELQKEGFIIDHLTEHGEKKYMGICKVEDIARRLDIRIIDYDAYYACLIYFTGSKDFNIQIRNRAIELGYSLSEYGLKKDNKIIGLRDEKELFGILGMEYLAPIDRNI
jgi:DNA polymerase beta